MTPLTALLDELESSPECATCGWYQTLPEDEQAAFDRYVQLSVKDSRRYSRERLHDRCVEMGYPFKLTTFKTCVRRHHVDK